jgi:glycosyltransferase involved in cell wall biosynthesis
MTDRLPKVSIGLAVFNGEKYLKAAIDSILSQTFTDFELIICDNASSDRTEQICREYAAKDSRIRYHRNATNIGGLNNEHRTFELSRGQYFRLAAHDDILAPTLVEKCVRVLDSNPSVVLCYSTTIKIDEQGKYWGTIDSDLGTSKEPDKRFRDLTRQHDCEIAYGLVRANILRKTELQPNYPESDYGFICELSLYGQFYRIPEPLFYRRYHSQRAAASYSDIYKKMNWQKSEVEERRKKCPSFIAVIAFLFYYQFIQFSHFFRIIQRSPITFTQSINCYLYATLWLFLKPHSELIGKTWKLRQRLSLTRAIIFSNKESRT